jgi:hypothetical protein
MTSDTMSDYPTIERLAVLSKTTYNYQGPVLVEESVRCWRELAAAQAEIAALREDAAQPTASAERDRKLRSQIELHENVKHFCDCADDKIAQQVCDGMWADRADDVLGLVEALKAVRTLAGESEEVRKTIDDAIEEHAKWTL